MEAAATYTATEEQLSHASEGELTGGQWEGEILARIVLYFQHLSAYLRSQASSILSVLPNQFRIACYWKFQFGTQKLKVMRGGFLSAGLSLVQRCDRENVPSRLPPLQPAAPHSQMDTCRAPVTHSCQHGLL